jgi:hypothetical protein
MRITVPVIKPPMPGKKWNIGRILTSKPSFGPRAYVTREEGPFYLDPASKPGAFESFLAKYIRATEFVIGLATGSIVLLVGSSALHGQSGRLPWFYAPPLLLPRS